MSIRQAVARYRKEGGDKLALEAADAFEQAARSAAVSPMSYAAFEPVPPVRRLVMDRFPYAVFFLANEDAVVVLDVLHTAMKPPDGF